MKRQITHLLLVLLASSTLARAETVAEDPAAAEREGCGARAAEAVQNRYRDVEDLSASFVQTSRPAGPAAASGPTTASGSVVLAVPGRMRWTYDKPEKSLVVSDGETLWLYDPAFGEAQKLAVGSGGYLSGAALQFLLGKGELTHEFEVRTRACDAVVAELALVPRTPAGYERLVIWVDPKRGDMHRIEISDLLGSRTLVEFSGVELNRRPAAALFRFEPPEGVSVIDLSTGS